MLRRISIFLLVIVICFAGCAGRKEAEPDPGVFEEAPDTEAALRRVTLYFLSDEGFLVPVTRLIPFEEGIAKASLSCMVSTPENVSYAREMGLSPVIPDGARLSLSIADGNALVDISSLPALPSRESETAMIESIVNTLTGFPTVNTVTITRDGKSCTLENGAELPVRQEAYALNPEDGGLAASTGGGFVTLYFPNGSGALTVPVSRRMGEDASLYSAVSALIKGTDAKGLIGCFPENTLLLGATLENRVVTINLSEDVKAVTQTEGMFSLMYKTVWLTLEGLADFDTLRFQVNGRDYAPEKTSAPNAANALAR